MDRRIEKTRTAIRNAYFELISKNAAAKISISEIARKANIDRKTFYLHYESVDDILKDFAHDKFEELMQRVADVSKENQPVDIRVLFETLNQIVEENMIFFRFIAKGQKYDYFFDRLKDYFVKILTRDYKHYFDFPETEFHIYAHFFVSGILSVYMQWIREELPLSLEEVAKLVSSAAYGGLRDLLPDRVQL